MGGKGRALAIILALVVALGFFAGQSSARSSSIDSPSLIQGGGAVAESTNEEVCKECACSNGGCACYDTFDACPNFCSGVGGCWCSDRFGCQCIKFIDQEWCKTKVLMKKKPISDVLHSTQ